MYTYHFSAPSGWSFSNFIKAAEPIPNKNPNVWAEANKNPVADPSPSG